MQKTIKLNNKTLTVKIRSDADESVFNEILVDHDYKILDPIIKNSKNCIIDVGAHIGLFSVYANTLNPNTKIFSFEPELENYKALKENLQLNHCKNISPKNLAIGAVEGKQTLYLSSDSHNHSFLNLNKDIDAAKDNSTQNISTKTKQTKNGSINAPQPNPTSISIQTTTLAKILKHDLPKLGIESCDLIKMDCEGAEFEIIKSIPKGIFSKIKHMYIEYHEYAETLRNADLKSILEKNGLKVKIFPSYYDKRIGFLLATNL
jgi:FkbM family methyltransferase